MEIQEIGKMIYTLRTEREISQEELCHGICSIATLSRLEMGERRPDILIFNALFQRLGKSMDYINTLLTLEEFEYFVKRRNIEISLLTKEYERAEEELKCLDEMLTKKGMSLQRQDIYRLQAFLYIYKAKDYEQAEKYIYKALKETIVEFDTIKNTQNYLINKLWLCDAELQLLMLYVCIRMFLDKEEMILLENFLGYICKKITDEKARNRELAKALHLQAFIYKKKAEWEKCYRCCEAVIKAEVKNGTIAILYQALELEQECLEWGVQMQNDKLRKKQFEHLKAVIEEYGEDIFAKDFIFMLNNVSQEKGLIDEVLRYSRMREGYSQEEFSEGICSPETLSRIETGKRNPTIKNFHALMDKLGVKMGYFNTEFVVDRFETLEKIAELKDYNIRKKYEKAGEMLEIIEKEIDMTNILNRQHIGLYHVVLDYRQGKVKIEDAMKRVEELLELSLKKIDGKFKFPYQPTPIEISLINQMAVYCRNIGKQKQAVDILMPIYEWFHQSKLDAPERSQKYFMIISNLSMYLEEIDDLCKATEFTREGVQNCIKYNVGICLGRLLISYGYIQERQKEDDYIKNYERGYYLCGLYEDNSNQMKLRKHMEEHKKNDDMEITKFPYHL